MSTTTLQLTEDATNYVVAEFVVSTTSDVLAAHAELLRLANTVSAYAEQPREALPVQEQVNAVVMGDADVVRALGYTLSRKPEPVVEPEPVQAESNDDGDDDTNTRLSRVESMLQSFARHFGVTL